MLQIIFHAVLCAAISHGPQVWCQLPGLRKHSLMRISLHTLLARVRVVAASHVTKIRRFRDPMFMVPSTQFAQAISPIRSNTCLTEHLIRLA